jgi:hypothetical protein
MTENSVKLKKTANGSPTDKCIIPIVRQPERMTLVGARALRLWRLETS